MKTCSDCKIEKEINNENFPFDKSRNRWLSVCKSCSVARTQKYRKKNIERWKQYDKNRNEKNKSIVDEWKSQGCSRCDEKRYWVIDAHHIDPSTKEYSIGHTSHGTNKIINELKKCIPLCSNCHRDLHYQQRKI